MALVTNLVRTQARRNALSDAAIRRTVTGGAPLSRRADFNSLQMLRVIELSTKTHSAGEKSLAAHWMS